MSAPSSYEQFLEAIGGAPEDDGLRLALAAFLRPYEPELAAFIELQVGRVARQRQSGSLDTAALSPEEQRLLARHDTAWSRGVGKYAESVAGGPPLRFHRGLVAQVAIDPDLFVERGAYLLKLAPIRHVDFGPLRDGGLAELLASDALARLDSVGFAGPLDDDAVVALAGAPGLGRCLYLDLGATRPGPLAAAALAAAPHLRQLLVVQHAGPGIEIDRDAAAAAGGDPPWLDPRNRVSRFDARWAVEHGLRPLLAAPLRD